MKLQDQAAYRDMLDELHQLVNAQGGYVAPGDTEGEARGVAIDAVLGAIERMGGMDPAMRSGGRPTQKRHGTVSYLRLPFAECHDTSDGKPTAERLVWHSAYGACPGGCSFDADALVDQDTGRPVQWSCRFCGSQPGNELPYGGYAADDWDGRG